jgi:transcriptional regulator with XRE-family HTH domain
VVREQRTENRDQRTVKSKKGEGAMRERERVYARKRLDLEMRSYRQAGREKNQTNGLLRAVRHALNVPVAEVAKKMGVTRSVIFDLEAREPKNTISLKSLSRMAEAMDCKVVYGIVPNGGKKLEDLAEKRLLASMLRVATVVKDQGTEVRDSG